MIRSVYYGTIRDVPCIVLGKLLPLLPRLHAAADCHSLIVLMKALGVKIVILSNAAGGLNMNYHIGDLMLIKDHISLLGMAGNNPLIGRNNEQMGTRFPSLCNAYDEDLRHVFHEIAKEKQLESLLRKAFTCVSRVPATRRLQNATSCESLAATQPA